MQHYFNCIWDEEKNLKQLLIYTSSLNTKENKTDLTQCAEVEADKITWRNEIRDREERTD